MTNWQPLESNSELITQYMGQIGMNTQEFVFQDLLSYEQWAQDMIQQPALGLLFIYEITTAHENHRKAEADRIEQEGQHVSPNVFYMKQYADNACGTIGVFHILGNLPAQHADLVVNGSMLAGFFAKTKGKSPQDTGHIFQNDEELKEKHVEATKEGTTNVNEHLETPNHFIAFVRVDGHLYELDGRKKFPINHGPTTEATFLSDACNAANVFIQREPDNVNAGLIVLAPRPLEMD